MANPSWDNPIKEWFAPFVECMLDNGYNLGDYGAVKASIGDIQGAIDGKRMPQGDPWPDAKIATFDAWVTAGLPEH
jgi:hypothetical protein